jgi:flagellin-like hook-associated protein FlgL
LTIVDTSGTGASGRVSLNGGPAVAFDSSQTNLEVIGANGEKVHIDTTSIAAGFNGDVDITADGTLSVDGGTSTTAIDFSASQTVTDTATGRQVRLNTSAVTKTGDDYLEFPGTTDIFQTLEALVKDLRGSRPLDSKTTGESLGRVLDRLEKLGDNLLQTIGVQSSALSGLEQVLFRNEDMSLQLQIENADLQSTDLPTAIIDLQSQQLLQQYTFSVTSRIMSQSLINFLS